MSTPSRKDLPPADSPLFLQKVRELLSTYLGNRGNVLDRGITVGDLSDAGVIKMDNQGNLALGDAVNNTVAISGSTYQVDLKPPPTPTGLTVSTGVSSIVVQCDSPSYRQGHGHQKCRLYGTNNNSTRFQSAILLTEFSGHVGSFVSNPATDWYLWLTWVSIDGVESIVPAGGEFGLHVRTGEDVSSLLTALNGKITSSQLFSTLGARIDLIDGPSTLAGSVSAKVKSVVDTQTGVNNAFTQSIATAQSAASGAVSAVQTETTTRAGITDGLLAQYTVKVDTNGYVSGFGLASTLKGSTPSSAFVIRADQFSIASPYGPGIAQVTPFSVVTTPQVINGVTVPVGVYMDAAFIKDGTISSVKIGDASIDSAKIKSITADQIDAGTLKAGSYIESAPFVVGTGTNPGQGWKLDSTSGTLYANQAHIWGTVYATAGKIGGNTITNTAVSSPNYVAGSAGWQLDSTNGSMNALKGLIGNAVIDGSGISSANYVPGKTGWKLDAISGTLEANSGHFLGDITGATGTFSGKLAAGTVDFASSVGYTYKYPNNGTTTLTATVTVPAAMTRVRITVQAAGGGGGGQNAYGYGFEGSGGGGGGGWGTGTFAVTPGQTLTVVVGVGGSGGSVGSSGSNGGSTSVTGFLTVLGGGGGSAPQGNSGPGLGGYAGNSYATAGGDANGAGGNSVMGTGGAPSTGNDYLITAYNGGGYGAGGGGVLGVVNYGKSGGKGANGYAVVEFFDPTGVVLRDSFDALKAQLRSLGIAVT
jgi:hypothetical protein